MKYICFFFALSLLFAVSCSHSGDVEESLQDSEQTMQSEQRVMIETGDNYCIYRSNGFQHYYEIYNTNGETVLSESTTRPFHIDTIGSDILDICTGFGTGLQSHIYYDVENDRFSDEFFYVADNTNELIAYIYVPEDNPFENRLLVVQDLFDKEKFYKEFKFDFSRVDTPIVYSEFSGDGKTLLLSYLSGDEEIQITETVVIE